MKSRSYRVQKVNEVRREEVAARVKDKAVMWAIAVAEVEQYGVLMDSEREVVVTVKWVHPAETPALLERLRGLTRDAVNEGIRIGRGKSWAREGDR